MIAKIEKILRAEPNIMAKDLAKMLGCKKNDLNPILYANPDKFVVDSEYRWRLKEKEITITFDGNRWVNCDSFEATLQNSIGDLEDAISIIFVLPEGCSFLLDALARLLAFCNQLAFSSKVVTVDFNNNGPLKHYLNRAGFFDHLDERVNVLPQRPTNSTATSHKGKSENLVELGIVTPHEDEAAKDELVKRLTNKFIALMSEKYKTAVSTIFAELTGNIQDHSETKLNGFAGLQKYGGSNPHIQTIISDSGVGIAASLRPSLQAHHKTLYDKYHKESMDNDIALVTEVMSKGLISRYGAGRGLGFQTSRDRALKFKAKYSVRQENFSLEFIFEGEQLNRVIEKNNLTKISGTHICFDFVID
jgi:hypothetical protein